MAEGAAAAKEARAQPSSVTANGATLQQVMSFDTTACSVTDGQDPWAEMPCPAAI